MNGIVSLCHFCEQHGPSVIFCTQAFHMTILPDCDEQTLFQRSRENLVTNLSESLKTHQETNLSSKSSVTCPSCSSLADCDKGLIVNDYDSKVCYIGTRFPLEQKLYSIVRQACVRSLSCEFPPGREGPVMYGDDTNGYCLGYMFRIKDSQARGHQRWYGLNFLMTDRIHLVATWPFLVQSFKALAGDMQGRAERCFEREIQYKKKASDSPFLSRVNNFSPLTPDQFLRKRGNIQLRYLHELMGDMDFFSHMHAVLSWILKASGSRLLEKQIEGPPIFGTSLKEKKPSSNEPGPKDVKPKSNESLSSDEETSPSLSNSSSRRRNFPNPTFDSLQELRMCLSNDWFRVMIYNLIVGNQIVVRGDSEIMIKSILRLLQELLPPSCCNVVEFDTIYQEAFRCNFLGLHSSVEIPPQVDRTSLALLDIKYDRYDDYENTGNYINHNRQNPKFNRFYFNVTSGSIRTRSTSMLRSKTTSSAEFQLYSNTNSFVTQLEQLLELNSSQSVLRLNLMVLKEEWVNKTKLMYKISRSGGGDNDENIKKLLKILGLKDHDLLVLKFWTAGMTKRYRSKLVST